MLVRIFAFLNIGLWSQKVSSVHSTLFPLWLFVHNGLVSWWFESCWYLKAIEVYFAIRKVFTSAKASVRTSPTQYEWFRFTNVEDSNRNKISWGILWGVKWTESGDFMSFYYSWLLLDSLHITHEEQCFNFCMNLAVDSRMWLFCS